MTGIVQTLEAITNHAGSLEVVKKDELRAGDLVIVRTMNSLYTIWALSGALYLVWGGWFDRQGISPQRVSINGCTWGGSAIKVDIIAALGLLLEFGNGVLTSPISRIRLIRARHTRSIPN